jgi:hypothetical protein
MLLVLVAIVIAFIASLYLVMRPQNIIPKATEDTQISTSSGNLNATSSAYSNFDFNQDYEIDLSDYSLFITALRNYIVNGIY